MPLTIPPSLTFRDLALELAPDGGILYAPDPLRRVAAANGIDPTDEDAAMSLIAAWYLAHQ